MPPSSVNAKCFKFKFSLNLALNVYKSFHQSCQEFDLIRTVSKSFGKGNNNIHNIASHLKNNNNALHLKNRTLMILLFQLPQNKGEHLDEVDRTDNNYLLENETFPEALAPAPTPRSPEPKAPPRR